MYVLISDWIPPRERNKLAVFIWSGVQFGTFLELPISGYLSSWLGWESVFYFNGICGIIWCIFYFLLTSNRPSMSNSISTVSHLYIVSEILIEFWLSKKNQISITSNRFDTTANSINFVEILNTYTKLRLLNLQSTNLLFWMLII